MAAVADSIRREQGTRVESVYVDISRPILCDDMVAAALKYFGRVDALVNVGGIDAPPMKAWEIDEAHWRELIEVDLNGPFWCIKSVMRHMMERRKGKIVTISSVTGRQGSLRYSPAYAAAKAGRGEEVAAAAADFQVGVARGGGFELGPGGPAGGAETRGRFFADGGGVLAEVVDPSAVLPAALRQGHQDRYGEHHVHLRASRFPLPQRTYSVLTMIRFKARSP